MDAVHLLYGLRCDFHQRGYSIPDASAPDCHHRQIRYPSLQIFQDEQEAILHQPVWLRSLSRSSGFNRL